MGIPAGVVKKVLSGVSGGPEVWQIGWFETFTDISSITDSNAALEVAGTTMTALLNAMKPMMNTSTQVTAYDLYAYTGGSGAAAHAHAAVSVTGTSTTPHPNQCAFVVTLRTATATRSGRGRLYFPANGAVQSAASGLYSTANCDALVDALAARFSAVAAGGQNAVVVSQTHTSKANITSCDADYVPDTQRRRSNKLRSVRHSHVV